MAKVPLTQLKSATYSQKSATYYFETIFGTSKNAKLQGNTQKDGPKRDPKGDKWGQIQEMSDFGTLKMQNC